MTKQDKLTFDQHGLDLLYALLGCLLVPDDAPAQEGGYFNAPAIHLLSGLVLKTELTICCHRKEICMVKNPNLMSQAELDAMFNSEKYLSRVPELCSIAIAIGLNNGVMTGVKDTGKGYMVEWSNGTTQELAYQYMAAETHGLIETISLNFPDKIYFSNVDILYIFSHDECDEEAEKLLYFLRELSGDKRAVQ